MALRLSDGTFIGSLAAQSLNGDKTPYQLWLEDGHSGTEAEYLASLQGQSAYQLWLAAGNVGTEAQYLASLAGSSGKSAYQIWKDLGNVGTEAQFIAALKGADGMAANPLLVSGLDVSRVRPGDFAIQQVGVPYLTPMHPSPTDLRLAFPFYVTTAGEVYKPGGLVPYPAGGLTPGHLIVNVGKASASAPNWVAVPAISAPLLATHTRTLGVQGLVVTPNSIMFQPRDPQWLGDDPALTPTFDNLSSYAVDNDTVLLPVYGVPWTALAASLRVGSDSAYPLSKFMRLNLGNASVPHVVTRLDSSTLDGELETTLEQDSGTVSHMRLYGRVIGAVGSETGVAFQIDLATDVLSFVTLVNGVATTVKKADGTDLTVPFVSNQGTIYRPTFRLEGTRLRGKIRVEGQPDPDWMIEGFTDAVMTPGLFGVGGDVGYLKVGQWAISKTTQSAPVA